MDLINKKNIYYNKLLKYGGKQQLPLYHLYSFNNSIHNSQPKPLNVSKLSKLKEQREQLSNQLNLNKLLTTQIQDDERLYDTARIPSYCDRIIYKTNGILKKLYYNAVTTIEELCNTDHLLVYSI